MTIRDDDSINVPSYARNDRGDKSTQVDVAPGVPTDRVRWGPILAGTFAAITVLTLLSALGAAIGFSTYDSGDNPQRFAIGAGIWGVISMLAAFGFGGWLAAYTAAVRGRDNGLLNGFMVAGVGIPILLLALGSASVLMTHAELANNRDLTSGGRFDAEAQPASAVLSDTPDANRNIAADRARTEDARRAAKKTAWSTLISLALAIGAASVAGVVGAKDDQSEPRVRNPRSGASERPEVR